jgi:hypothetical protein
MLLRAFHRITVISMRSNFPLPGQITQSLRSTSYKNYVLQIVILLITKSKLTQKEISESDICHKIDCLYIGRENFVDCCVNSP